MKTVLAGRVLGEVGVAADEAQGGRVDEIDVAGRRVRGRRFPEPVFNVVSEELAGLVHLFESKSPLECKTEQIFFVGEGGG